MEKKIKALHSLLSLSFFSDDKRTIFMFYNYLTARSYGKKVKQNIPHLHMYIES